MLHNRKYRIIRDIHDRAEIETHSKWSVTGCVGARGCFVGEIEMTSEGAEPHERGRKGGKGGISEGGYPNPGLNKASTSNSI